MFVEGQAAIEKDTQPSDRIGGVDVESGGYDQGVVKTIVVSMREVDELGLRRVQLHSDGG